MHGRPIGTALIITTQVTQGGDGVVLEQLRERKSQLAKSTTPKKEMVFVLVLPHLHSAGNSLHHYGQPVDHDAPKWRFLPLGNDSLISA